MYAGCGPYATLLTPLLPLFKAEEIEVILIDINEYSIQSAKEIIVKLQLEDYIADAVCTNAINYKKPESWPLHLLISETMFNALTREPQLAITANLAPQLVHNGILIPEEVNIDLVYTFFGKETYLNNKEEVFHQNKSAIKHEKVDRLFSLNKRNNFSEKTLEQHFQFESKVYEVPKENENRRDICLFTEVKIFNEFILNNAKSFITNPHCITAISNLGSDSKFQLIYDFKENPNWTYRSLK